MATFDNSPSQRITPFLWFEDRAEEAVKFYTSLFKDSSVLSMSRLPAEAPGMEGRMLTAAIRLKGLDINILEGGPMFQFTPAISLFVHCETQEEIDFLWDNLVSDGGLHNQCGWLTDKFGVTWQIVPDALGQLMGDPNPVKARNVQQAMMKMGKLEIAGLQAAYDKE